MAINRYFQPTRYQGNFYTPPLDILQETLQGLQEQYNTNYVLSQQIKNKYIDALAQDRAQANTIQDEWEGRIDQIVKKYSGDYSQATKDLNLLLSDMQKEYNPGGRAHAIQYNYKTWTDHWKNVQEGIQKGTYTAVQGEALQGYFNRSYQGIGQKDAVTGAYNLVNPPSLQKYVDEQEIVQKVIEKVPKRSSKTVVPVPDGKGRYIMQEREYEYIDGQEMYDAVTQQLLSNDAWIAYNSQLALLQGKDPHERIVGAIDSLASNVVPLYSGVLKKNEADKIEYDQIHLKQLDHQLALQRQRERDANAAKRVLLRHALETGEVGAEETPQDLTFIGSRGSASAYKPIPPGGLNIKANKSPYPTPFTEKATYQQIYNNPSAYKSYIDVDLLNTAKQAAEKWRDKNGQPARDKAALTMDIYNKNLKDVTGNAIYMSRLPSYEAMEKEARRLLPHLQSGAVQLWEFDNKSGSLTSVDENAAKRADIFKSLWNVADNKPAQVALGRTSVQTGVPYSTVFAKADGTGYYLVGEMHEDVRRANKDLFPAAFGFINTPTRTQGGSKFQFTDNGKILDAYGKVVYSVDPNDPTLIRHEIGYFDPTPDPSDPYGGRYMIADGIPMSPADMEEKLFPRELKKRFMVKEATKADYTPQPEYLEYTEGD